MPSGYGFRWRDGRGWLILIGEADPYGDAQSDIRAQAIGLSSSDGGVACVDVAGDAAAADRLLEDMEDLGAPSGYIVDLAADDDETLRDRLRDAAIIVLAGESDGNAAYSSLTGAAMEGIAAAHDVGAVVLAEMGAAAALGALIVPGEDAINPNGRAGFGWVENAAIMPLPLTNTDNTRALLAANTGLNGLGLGDDSAIVFGPDGEVEVWGARQIKVLLNSRTA